MIRKLKAILRVFINLAIFVFFILSATLSFIAGFIYLLPAFVSEQWFKENLENLLSKNLQTPLQIEKIEWQWETGIKIYGLCLKDDPVFSDRPMFLVDSAWIDIDFGDLFEKKIILHVLADQVSLNLVRDKKGYTNLEEMLSRLPGTKDKDLKHASDKDSNETAFKLPFEVKADIALNNMFLNAQDQLLKKELTLKHTSFHLNIPSLSSKPVALEILSSPELDGRKISPISLNILIKNLFDSEKALNLKTVNAKIKSSLPGTSISIVADPGINENNTKAEINISCDLKELSNSFSMFLPQHLSSAKAGGNINLSLKAGGNPQKAVVFDLSLKANDLNFSGGPLNEKSLNFSGFNASTAGDLNLALGRLEIKTGNIKLLNNSGLLFKGNITGLLKEEKKAELTAEDLKIDIGELADEFSVFIPENILNSGLLNSKENSPGIKIKEINLSGNIPHNTGEIKIKDFFLNIPVFNHKDLDISASNINLSFSEIKISDIRTSKSAMFGLTAKADISQSLNITEINGKNLGNLQDIKQSSILKFLLPLKGSPEVNISKLDLAIPSIKIEDKKYKALKTSLDINGKISAIKINTPEKIDIEGLQFNLAAAKFLTLYVEARAKNTGAELLHTKGSAEINLSEIPKNILALIPLKIKAKGSTELGWDFTGRIPDKDEIKKLSSSASFKMEKDLAFIDKTELSLAIKQGGFEMPVSKDQVLKINRISTSTPFQYSFNQKDRKGTFNGAIVLNKIEKIPYVTLKKPLNIDIMLSGTHDDFYSFNLSQDLNINPGGIKERWEVSLYGIDHVLKRGYKKPSALWLNHVGGQSHVTLTMKNLEELKIFANLPDINGNMTVNTDFKLVPGKSIDSKIRLRSSETHVKWKDILRIKNLNTDIQLERLYHLVQEGSLLNKNQAHKKIEKQLFLSSEVLKSEALSGFTNGEENTSSQRFIGELQNRFNKKHSLSLEMLQLKSPTLPLLEVQRSVADINLNQGLPGMEFFQTEMLGGTVMGSFFVFERKTRFFSQAKIAFSSLDAQNFFPGSQNTSNNADTELSGQLKVLIPLSTSMFSLINELEFEIYFSHIGPRFLERTLYALDPYESNENIASLRQILKTGSPRWIKITVSSGRLSLDGEIDAKGVRIAIPSLNRINLTGLSGIDKYEKYLSSLKPLIKALEISSKDIMIIKKNGTIKIGD